MDKQHLYRSSIWQLTVLPPWQLEKADQCVEITQPEGIGALHISAAQKDHGNVSESDLQEFTTKELPEDVQLATASFGKFFGYGASYTDRHTDIFWKKWWLGCGAVMLYVTYNCSRGDEEFELAQVESLLTGLEPISHDD
jgi:hypothetical protein